MMDWIFIPYDPGPTPTPPPTPTPTPTPTPGTPTPTPTPGTPTPTPSGTPSPSPTPVTPTPTPTPTPSGTPPPTPTGCEHPEVPTYYYCTTKFVYDAPGCSGGPSIVLNGICVTGQDILDESPEFEPCWCYDRTEEEGGGSVQWITWYGPFGDAVSCSFFCGSLPPPAPKSIEYLDCADVPPTPTPTPTPTPSPTPTPTPTPSPTPTPTPTPSPTPTPTPTPTPSPSPVACPSGNACDSCATPTIVLSGFSTNCCIVGGDPNGSYNNSKSWLNCGYYVQHATNGHFINISCSSKVWTMTIWCLGGFQVIAVYTAPNTDGCLPGTSSWTYTPGSSVCGTVGSMSIS
jgi:hypothetical protein